MTDVPVHPQRLPTLERVQQIVAEAQHLIREGEERRDATARGRGWVVPPKREVIRDGMMGADWRPTWLRAPEPLAVEHADTTDAPDLVVGGEL